MEAPNLIMSGLSTRVVVEGHLLVFQVYKIETEPKGSLEVVGENNTPTAWDDLFDTDRAVKEETERTTREESLHFVEAFLFPD
ncbi:hypothetical protein GCM10017044_10250 [Kordiimonas sediminis]|uniref:Uncharacterized protein n=1 Tax=Kordiimonas sediminis TaxID=1735581 RepID=A0A919ANY9_9PROT|nr:hypothetical protein [Kordiimonas sediminis]GHF17773.1 hypothetical protein GCM10017044_10250 [Kordiimonas sediminis]